MFSFSEECELDSSYSSLSQQLSSLQPKLTSSDQPNSTSGAQPIIFPALTASLFPNVPPTINFVYNGCKGDFYSYLTSALCLFIFLRFITTCFNFVSFLFFFLLPPLVDCLPSEMKRLLRWRLSPITPLVVKSALMRAGFKITKSK